MSERFTEEKKLLADCMQLLIKIYYIEEHNISQNYWWKDDSVELLRQLFARIFGLCDYNLSTREFTTYLQHNIKAQIFEINNDDKLSFICIMRNLFTEIENGYVRHFDLIGIETNVISDFSDKRYSDLNELKSPLIFHKNKNSHCVINRKEIRKLDDKALPILKGEVKRKMGVMEIASVKYNTIKVAPVRGSYIAWEIINAKPPEDPIVNIPEILWPHDNFIRLFRSILVHFHVVFRDYSRLKVCQNDNCRHIHFENRKNRRKYCGDSCKGTRYNQEEPDRRKCRDRQNHWYRLKANTYSLIIDSNDFYIRTESYVSKNDCHQCENTSKGGECQALRKRNSEAFALIDKDKPPIS